MFELKITANTVEELIAQAAALAGLGVTVSGAPEVPLPEMRIRLLDAEAATEPKRRGRPPKAQSAPPAGEETVSAPEDPATQDGGLGALELGTARPTETASVQTADAGQDTSASATPASEDLAPAEEVSSPSSPASEPDAIAPGYPAVGEVYMLNGDEWVWNPQRGVDRRDTYKDGEPFSDAGRGRHLIYEDHAPASLFISAASKEEVKINTPEDESDDLPPELTTLIETLDKVESWPDTKVAMKTFMDTPLFKGMPDDQANRMRRNIWETLADERKVSWLPDHLKDISAFRLWIEAQEDADNIRGALITLRADPEYQARPDAVRAQIEGAADVRIGILEG